MHTDPPGTEASPAELAARALFAVLNGAAAGDLPPFAWTLDLPQDALLALIGECLPGTLTAIPLSALHYATLRQQVPRDFRDLLALLLDARAPDAPPAAAEWTARAVVAACFGDRHLWQDLGLTDRSEVSSLLSGWFPALYQSNVRNLKWKRFLFAELSARRGKAELFPPGCSRCDDFPSCFPGRPQPEAGKS